MVLSLVGRIVQTGFKYRKQIYRTLVAQDRAIDKAFKVGGYSRATRYGVRHGALAGSIIGTVISNLAPETPGNEFQIPWQKRPRPQTRKPYQTRSRQPRSDRCWYPNRQNFTKRRRFPSTR